MKSVTQWLPALFTALLVGCETTYVLTDEWTYRGKDEALRAPPRVPRGDLSDAAWAASRHQSETRWLQQREEAIERAKDNCARETGTSKTPGYWFGYSGSFKTCMAAYGWSVGGSPL